MESLNRRFLDRLRNPYGWGIRGLRVQEGSMSTERRLDKRMDSPRWNQNRLIPFPTWKGPNLTGKSVDALRESKNGQQGKSQNGLEVVI